VPCAPTEPPAHATAPVEQKRSLELAQLARAVKRGQRITAYLPEQAQVTGYLAGIDETTWFILDPDVEEERVRYWLIPRRDRVLEIHPKPTFGDEPERLRREMETIIVHFRTWFKNNVQLD
jgi:hypothetical protein